MSTNKSISDIFSRPVPKPSANPAAATSSQMQGGKEGQTLLLDHLSIEELLQLRTQIDERLPVKRLKDMDLEQEAVIQYLTLKSLLERTLSEDDTAANQKAQVANATAGALQALDKMQRDTFTFERFKGVENALVAMLNEWPIEMTKKFFEEYERSLYVR